MDDRATAVEHVVNMGKQLADDANIAKLSKRWNVLLSKVDERDSSLQITLQSSRDFTAHVDPFSEWLISAEKQQQNMQLPVAESSVVKSAISKQNVCIIIFLIFLCIPILILIKIYLRNYFQQLWIKNLI